MVVDLKESRTSVVMAEQNMAVDIDYIEERGPATNMSKDDTESVANDLPRHSVQRLAAAGSESVLALHLQV